MVMASQKLTDYELKRLENIRRNNQLILSLKLRSIATPKTKRPWVRAPHPTVIRRSLRKRGLAPEVKALGDGVIESAVKSPNPPRNLGALSTRDVYTGVSDRALIETILRIGKKPQLELGDSVEGQFGRFQGCKDDKEVGSDFKLESITLNQDNIARVGVGRIVNVSFFPCTSSTMIVVGNYYGDVGIWHCDSQEENRVYLYRPHSNYISGISIQQHCISKIFTSSSDGFIRLMDAEKEVFDLVYSSDESIFCLSQQSKDPKCLYFGKGNGGFSIWDERAGTFSAQLTLHKERLNSINFNSENSNIMATSSTDGTACIWDLRNIDNIKTLKTVSHKRSVYSAYFSPSGRSLATTSTDDKVGIVSGVNFEDISMIYHANRNWSRAIWGWDDSYLFIGNRKGGVDVISPVQRNTVFTLKSPYISSMPCRFDAHPFNVGTLAGGTSTGQVYMWTLGNEELGNSTSPLSSHSR